jgi:hypothetical protein
MRKPRCVLILFVLLGFCVSLGFPADDVLETDYDESEALPYENTPLFSIVVPQASARVAKADLSFDSLLRFNSLTIRCKRRRETVHGRTASPDSLTIINHSLRC